MVMRLQVLIIAVLASFLAWGGSFHVARTGYHVGQRAGLVPNLHIRHRVHEVVDFALDTVAL
jgi:hypothetical protein